MPSVRVKKGYQSIADAQPSGRPRSQSLVSYLRPATPHSLQEDSTTDLRRSRTRASDGPGLNGGRSPKCRPRALSKVSQHILSTTRQVPQPSSVHPPSDTPGPSLGPPRLSNIQENSRPHSFRLHTGTYSVEGQQAELRVPVDQDQDRRSSISAALEQLNHDEERDDSLEEHHPDDIVEHLDVIDPQISTVSTLTNAANAIVVPPLSFYSRKPVIVLPRLRKKKKRKEADPEKGVDREEDYEYQDALDQHVEDVLTKRDQFRRVMQGVWSFVKTPLGIVTAIYGFFVVFWGTGIVFFLAKFINLHNDITQGYWVELCQQVETGLFTATSIGFIPFRVMDTYRICKIWHYKRKITKLRQKAGLPELYDPDDLPDPVYDPNYIHVLSESEQVDLHYQQHKFMASQTWYRPHGTPTHRAFPIDLALWICVCNDLNSFFQCLLSGTMWGLDRFQRPAWTTGTTLPAAFVAGIVAGVLIYWGGRKTRRTEQVRERLRLALEMERDPDHGSPVLPAITLESESIEEGPQPAPAAPSTTAGSTETETATATEHSEPEKAAADAQERGAGSEAEKELKLAVRPKNERLPSGRSLRFADEMVVPEAERLP